MNIATQLSRMQLNLITTTKKVVFISNTEKNLKIGQAYFIDITVFQELTYSSAR